MISFAQNLEDVMLARAFREQERGFYIDVGAWDPVVDSVTKHFYDRGWTGINIEPVEKYFALLTSQRPRDINLRLAVGERRERRMLNCFEESGLSTLSDEHLEEFASLGLRSEGIEVEVSTLREVCEEHVRGEIDFLKIDVEGWELPVIRGGHWTRFRPKIVLVEAVAPNIRAILRPELESGPPAPAWNDWEDLLLSQGFQFCYFDGLNRFYVRNEDRHLQRAFQAPANVYDGFVPYQLVKAQAERGHLAEELQRVETLAAQRAEEIARLTARYKEAQEKLRRVGIEDTAVEIVTAD